jgi:hypothetical protein
VVLLASFVTPKAISFKVDGSLLGDCRPFLLVASWAWGAEIHRKFSTGH